MALYVVDREVERERAEATAAGEGGSAAGSGSAGGDGAAAEDGAAGGGVTAGAPGLDGGPASAVGRMANRTAWVDRIVDQAIARGEFDDLPLAGKPIPGLGAHDPDWWLRNLVEREGISGVLPEALQLRTDDRALDARLDEVAHEPRVREVLEEFNARVVAARRQLLGGPPVVTPLRDVEAEVVRWRARRVARRAGP